MSSESSAGDQGTPDVTELLIAAKAGSSAALETLLNRYRPFLLRFATTDVPRELQAKVGGSDLVQESLLQASQNLCKFAGNSEPELLAWLRKILLNRTLNEIRHWQANKRDIEREQGAAPLSGLANAGKSPSSEFGALEERVLVKLALLRLPQHYQDAIQYRHEDDLSFAEMGMRLQCTEDAARKIWARAVAALQKELG